MGVNEERDRLIELELQQAADRDALEAARSEFEASAKRLANLDPTVATRDTEIKEQRRRLARAEAEAAARARKEGLDEDVARLVGRFTEIAYDKPWFKGTGNDDSILPHQWQGAMFGAVAKRWILGDGVGLGKTRQVLGWLDLIEAKKVLIVCEANICDQFAGEVMELSPHRKVVNLYKKLPVKRHELLDNIMSMDEAVVVVNFEIWRRDRDALARFMDWQLDTLVVDEAHNLKTTSTANFRDMRMLISCDNVCPNCKGHIYGLYDPKYLQANPSRKVPMPCAHCGWKVGDPTPTRHHDRLEELLSSRSIKNLCFTTGTPILNSPLDLFSLLHLINPILFDTASRFQTAYLSNNYHSGRWEFRDGALKNLKPLIEDFFIARTREDAGVVVPKQTVNVIPIDLDKAEYPLQYRTIKQISEAAQIVLDNGQAHTIMHLMSMITRKRQANVWPGGIVITDTNKDSETYGDIIFDSGSEVDESVKMDRIIANIQLKLPRRQIVFSQFKTALAELEARLRAEGIRVVRFDGDTPKNLREEIKLDFDRRKMGVEAKWDVVLANYKTGGTGLNFTAATVTHVMDEEWNPGKRNQGYGRTDRIGQTEETEVLVYRIRGSIDTWMSNLISYKEEIVNGFHSTMRDEDSNPTVVAMISDLKTAMTSGEIL